MRNLIIDADRGAKDAITKRRYSTSMPFGLMTAMARLAKKSCGAMRLRQTPTHMCRTWTIPITASEIWKFQFADRR